MKEKKIRVERKRKKCKNLKKKKKFKLLFGICLVSKCLICLLCYTNSYQNVLKNLDRKSKVELASINSSNILGNCKVLRIHWNAQWGITLRGGWCRGEQLLEVGGKRQSASREEAGGVGQQLSGASWVASFSSVGVWSYLISQHSLVAIVIHTAWVSLRPVI